MLPDHRDPYRIEHCVEALIKQRVLGLCLGYEDLNDHDELCRDRLLALLCDRDDLTGEFRRVESDRGKPLAGKSTLNRLERTPLEGPEGAYKKIVADPAGMDALLLEVFAEYAAFIYLSVEISGLVFLRLCRSPMDYLQYKLRTPTP